MKKFTFLVLIISIFISSLSCLGTISQLEKSATESSCSEKKLIKWVDFTPTYKALSETMSKDIETHSEQLHINWIESLAYLACIYGGDFKKYSSKDFQNFVKKRQCGTTIQEITQNSKHYKYYHEVYTAVLGEFLGYYNKSSDPENEKYGLKVFLPIAKRYPYSHYDDFGAGRSYGYKRKHLGHDMMAAVGTPIIAVESGYVEAVGWNKYGGWRVGIRSFDKKRYYYYAHLRKDRPFHVDLKEGGTVTAGDVIGYVGRSGYSTTENINNITENHLHFGMQLVFDESQKECNNEIWIDVYQIILLLEKNKSDTVRNNETKEHFPKDNFNEKPNCKASETSLNPTSQTEINMNLDNSPNACTTASPTSVPPEVELPIIMYHNVTKNKDLLGKFAISPYKFEDDLKFIKKLGLNTVSMTDVINYVHKGEPLPDKPIVLSFDDGNFSDYNYVFPLLKKYNMKAVISVIGNITDEYTKDGRTDINYPNVTWEQIKQMKESGLIDIQCHSYDLHFGRGVLPKTGENEQDFSLRFSQDVSHFQQRYLEELGSNCNTFTYPFGKYNEQTENILKDMDFLATLTCQEGKNMIKVYENNSLFQLHRTVRPNDASTWEIFNKMGVV